MADRREYLEPISTYDAESAVGKEQIQRTVDGDVPVPTQHRGDMDTEAHPESIPGIEEPIRVTIAREIVSTVERRPDRSHTRYFRVTDGTVHRILSDYALRYKATVRVETENAATVARVGPDGESLDVMGFLLTDGNAHDIKSTDTYFLRASGGYVDVYVFIEEFTT